MVDGSTVATSATRTGAPPALAESREFCRRQAAHLPAALQKIDEGPCSYPVRISPGIAALAHELDAQGD